MTNNIDLLNAILSSDERTVRGAAFANTAGLEPLVIAGVLVPAGHVEAVLCSDCDTPHFAEVRQIGGQLGWLCPEAGFILAKPTSVAAYEIRRDTLALRLHTAIGAKSHPKPWPPNEPILWQLGECNFDRWTISVCLVPNIGEPTILDEAARFLKQVRGRPHATALLTNDARDLGSVLSKEDMAVIPLANVASLNVDGNFAVDIDALARWALPRRLLQPKGPGRPPLMRSLIHKTLALLEAEGFEAESDRALEDEVRKRMKPKPLAHSTFVVALGNYRLEVE